MLLEVEAAIGYLRIDASGKKQEKVVQRVLAVQDFPYLILGLKGPEDDNKVEAASKEVLSATNPRVNKHPEAEEAWKSKWKARNSTFGSTYV